MERATPRAPRRHDLSVLNRNRYLRRVWPRSVAATAFPVRVFYRNRPLPSGNGELRVRPLDSAVAAAPAGGRPGRGGVRVPAGAGRPLCALLGGEWAERGPVGTALRRRLRPYAERIVGGSPLREPWGATGVREALDGGRERGPPGPASRCGPLPRGPGRPSGCRVRGSAVGKAPCDGPVVDSSLNTEVDLLIGCLSQPAMRRYKGENCRRRIRWVPRRGAGRGGRIPGEFTV